MTVFRSDLGQQMEKLARKYELRMDKFCQQVTMQLAEEVIRLTPVDTGFARGSWWLALNGASGAGVGVDQSGGSAIGAINLAAMRIKAGDIVLVGNNADYIRKLEYGHSKQAPFGMVRVTLAHAPMTAYSIARKLSSGGR